jgi:N-acetylneuraminate synthase
MFLQRFYRFLKRNFVASRHVKIGRRYVGPGYPVFIVAEIGVNHNGSLALAKKLIDGAKEAGADAVKFQMRDMDSLYQNRGKADYPKENLSTQYTLDLLSRFELKTEELYEAFDYAKSLDIFPFCTAWDEESLSKLEAYGVEAYKVASADLTNHDLLRKLARTGKPLICSVGMSADREVRDAIALLREEKVKYVLLQCNSTYPTPFKDIHLRYMKRLTRLGSCPVGYSGHERGINVPIAAVALGAHVIEKHITIDKNLEGNDHKVSLLPVEFKEMVESIRQVEEALGIAGPRIVTQGERMNRVNLAKSVVAARDITQGQRITKADLTVKSPGRGLQPNAKERLIGKVAKRNFKAGDFFYKRDLIETEVKPRHYNFKRPWGLPVRFHDFERLIAGTNPHFVEFHLSYKDLELNPKNFITKKYPELGVVVHSPDTFEGDHLLNPASDDDIHRTRSRDELQKVISFTRDIAKYFKPTKNIPLVVSLQGVTRSGFATQDEQEAMYTRLIETLKTLDTEGVAILPQTLPPFPWLFGGQLYHNLFVNPHDIADFCKKNNFKICLDISHSKLAANHFNWSFEDFVRTVGPYVDHLHIVDAAGNDAEGLQIGDGDIDFSVLAKILDEVAPQASFIPEIWQGHENNGEGFHIALDRLEKWF